MFVIIFSTVANSNNTSIYFLRFDSFFFRVLQYKPQLLLSINFVNSTALLKIILIHCIEKYFLIDLYLIK